MLDRSARGCLTVFLGCALSCPLDAQASQEEFFGLDRIWDVHITVDSADWKQLFPSASQSPTRLFGKFPYRPAAVTIGAHRFENVGFRMKGNATFLATGGTLKRSLKIDFDRFVDGQRFLGMGKLNLQCNALDGTQIKEAVSYSIYRACGVPAGRTAFARVYVTMPDVLEKAYVGLYTVVEQVDQRFAKRVLGSEGLILKPDGETLGYYGAAWNDDYEAAYHPKSAVTDALAQPLIATADLFDEPDDDVFAAGLEAVMDVDGFLAYTAVTAILINSDSPLTVPDNHYLVVPEATKKVTWVPWDMNWSMGEYGRVTQTPHLELSVLRPTEKEIFWRVLGIPKFEQRYREILARCIEGPCSAEAMRAAVEQAEATAGAARTAEEDRDALVTDAGEELGGRRRDHRMLSGRAGDNVEGLIEFVERRAALVAAELRGEHEGKPARNLFGTDERMPRGDGVRDAFIEVAGLDPEREAFDGEALDAVLASAFAALDRDNSDTVDAEEVARVLHRRARAAGMGFLARLAPARGERSVRYLDGDGDGLVDGGEWEAGVQALQRYWDRDLDGRWSRRELGLSAP